MTSPELPEGFRRSLADWAHRPAGTSAAVARRTVAARLRAERVRTPTRLLAAAAAAVALAGVWLAARADRFHGVAAPPAQASQVPAAAPTMIVMRLRSGATLYVALPSHR